MTSDDHPELGFSDRLQMAWAHGGESIGTIRRGMAGELRGWFRRRSAVAMPDLTWRDWMLFGCTGASILVALVTFAIVLSDTLARGTP